MTFCPCRHYMNNKNIPFCTKSVTFYAILHKIGDRLHKIGDRFTEVSICNYITIYNNAGLILSTPQYDAV